MKKLLRTLLLCLFCSLLLAVTASAETAENRESSPISYVGLSARTRTDYVGLRSLYAVDRAKIAALEENGHRVTYGALMGIGEENGEAVLSHADMTVAVEGDTVVAYGAGTRGYRTAAVVVYDTENGYGASGIYVSHGVTADIFAYTTLYTAENETVQKLKETALVYRAFLIVDGTVTYVDAISDVFGGDTGYGTATSLYELSTYLGSREAGDTDAGYQNHVNIRKVISLCMNTSATIGNGVDTIDVSDTYTLRDMKSGIYTAYADAAFSVTVNGVTAKESDGTLSVRLAEGDNTVTVASDDALTQIFFYSTAELPVEDSYRISGDDMTVREGGSYRLYAVYTADADEILSVTLGDEAYALSLYTGSGFVSSSTFTLAAGTFAASLVARDATVDVYLVRESHTVSLVGKDGDILSVQKVYDGKSAVVPTVYFGDDLLYFDGETENVTEDRMLYGFFGSQFDYTLVGDTATLTAYTGSHDRLILPETLDGYRVTAVAAGALDAATQSSYLYIPESIVTLESGALSACTSLSEIAVNARNTAFTAKDGDLYTKDEKTLVRLAVASAPTMIKIESGVTAIGDYALCGATSKNVLLPASIISIGKGAFSNMKKLVAVYYSGSITAWNGVSVAGGNSNISMSTLYYYSATRPSSGDENNYWYYNKNGNVAIYQNSSWTPPVA